MLARVPQAALASLISGVVLATLPAPAAAQAPVSYTLNDLKNLFVVQQQYFILDNEQSVAASLNHLHITALDTTTGEFSGLIWAPVIEPFVVPQINLPVLGTITIDATGTALGSFYGITFNWSYIGSPCLAGSRLANPFEDGMYTGAITFLGYQGSGKMHALIAGTASPGYGECTGDEFVLGPIPFSGLLTK
ncbi:MAG: hypothetical protein WDN69_01850 [Aliidongia sp.]